MAMRFHPDKCTHPQAADVFKKINAAHNILSDPQKRRVYDQNKNASMFSNNPNSSSRGHEFCILIRWSFIWWSRRFISLFFWPGLYRTSIWSQTHRSKATQTKTAFSTTRTKTKCNVPFFDVFAFDFYDFCEFFSTRNEKKVFFY